MKKTGSVVHVLLRIVVGWHLFYEGLVKLFQAEWSAGSYLEGSYGFLSDFFHTLARDPVLISIVDFLNIWGLILIGTALMLGMLIRVASLAGILLLLTYYFAYPPFGTYSQLITLQGHFWIVNWQLIEALLLLLVFITRPSDFSIQNILVAFRKKKKEQQPVSEEIDNMSRRRALLKGLVTLPFFGAVAYTASARNKAGSVDALAGATIKATSFDLEDLEGILPNGKIGDLEISRLILGCNLIGGWAHARDLLYVGNLFRQYNTEAKIFETLQLCEKAGINTCNMVTNYFPVFNKYRKYTGSEMQTICQVYIKPEEKDPFLQLKEARDFGTTSMYIQGACSDRLVQDNRMDLLWEGVEFIRGQGMLGGVGAHSVQVPLRLHRAGLKPDYCFKTMHHDKYWSAHPREYREEFSVDRERYLDHNKFHDNLFDVFPEQTVEAFREIDVPLFGFKVLAAGAIPPAEGFRYAFEKGSDFICVGMFDFQVVENVNTAIEILNGPLPRERPWYA